MHLSYTSQGNVAGAPDYGIVPSGLLAMAVFKKFSAYSDPWLIMHMGFLESGLAMYELSLPSEALTSGYFVIAAVSVLCACHPSLLLASTLVH